jgi:hypothetical protein
VIFAGRPVTALRIAAGLLALALTLATTASAKILKTRVNRFDHRGLPLLFGSGIEYETDSEETEYGFPFVAEYNLTDIIKLGVEPSYVLVRKKSGGSISGPGDLETTLTLEFPTERRVRPGFSLESTIIWPTAPRGSLGTGEADYSFGAIASKEFSTFDVDVSAVYTFVGDPPGVRLENILETSIATEWHFTPDLDLEAEAVSSIGTGGRFRGATGTLGSFANLGGPEQGQNEWEATLGVAEHLNDFLKLEQGAVMKNDGSWQIVVAWEWDFGGR